MPTVSGIIVSGAFTQEEVSESRIFYRRSQTNWQLLSMLDRPNTAGYTYCALPVNVAKVPGYLGSKNTKGFHNWVPSDKVWPFCSKFSDTHMPMEAKSNMIKKMFSWQLHSCHLENNIELPSIMWLKDDLCAPLTLLLFEYDNFRLSVSDRSRLVTLLHKGEKWIKGISWEAQ